MTDVREHPDYEKGYNDRWHGKRARLTGSEYMAGYAAAHRARDAFAEAGFRETAPGLFTKTETIRPLEGMAAPGTKKPEKADG